ncbi:MULTISPECIES: hypothetical protein [unclassified Acinetobacter]|uniref:hypothetical protein n=1 Tax=unclassified Acinetobacter TaxID=196816 RepID=UPI00244B5499|nr:MULTISPECIES: hypothetical protein [unclassified Acinetobacter]MDH0032554.1 hypothetical protein [Acinetobacter sp. GD04021]MDH0885245.1 hypothetical protein [Acinetobacter sp. GD03873]MDH1084427.1 hypothetical protein [Acinetobacter sp. GD03983]MDH2188315.1 hypothetical protein [Acinetobacter sp. GD03645]MDH2203826.1 hypothetical protein [Acinetobacter sp. GD03647]
MNEKKFVAFCKRKNKYLDENYIAHTYRNGQELYLVQFLNEEIKSLDELYLKQCAKTEELQERINIVMSLFGCQEKVSRNDIIEALIGDDWDNGECEQ